MLRVALLSPNSVTANGIQHLALESGVFDIALRGEPLPPAPHIIRVLGIQGPELVLLDLNDWDAVSHIAREINESKTDSVVIGFTKGSSQMERRVFHEAGIVDLLRDPFSAAELEAVAYEALHRDRRVDNKNILAFLPAKAGGGCSTVALNTAGALVNTLNKKVLLIESDTRSGVLSFKLNLEDRTGLREALAQSGELTPVEWRRHYSEVSGIHVLLANPARRGALPRWNDYYQLLYFLQKEYDFILVDLPEVINDATAEIVRTARGVLIVCEPELASLKLTKQRCTELESCEIASNSIHVVVNRWEHSRMTVKDVEEAVAHPVFATVPNDYSNVKNAVLNSRLAAATSPFAKGCTALARKLGGLPETRGERLKFALLQSLGRIASQ
jgi:Mrp family chromosome partitioning ATPase